MAAHTILNEVLEGFRPRDEEKPKHTPGPWRHHPPTGAVKDASFKLVASVYGDREDCMEDERQAANARLIAAAPEMYEALKEVQRACSSLREVPMADQTRALQMMRAAIAKAEGR